MRCAACALALVACRAELDVGAAIRAADAPLPDAAPDARPGTVDLAPLASGRVYLQTLYIPPGSCEIAEGCVGAAGNRRLLRFDAVTANLGTADLALGPTPPAGVSSGPFVWSACHGHHHVPGFEAYALVGDDGALPVARKQAYCLRDDLRVRDGAPRSGYDCTDQGVSAGWADLYQAELPCQWLDVTDVEPGAYTLRITANPDHVFPDDDPTDDVLEQRVLL